MTLHSQGRTPSSVRPARVPGWVVALTAAGGLALGASVQAQSSAAATAPSATRPAAVAKPAPPAAGPTLRLAVLTWADDERFDERRAELDWPGHPGGRPDAAVAVAIDESAFELESARVQVQVESLELRQASELRPTLARLEQAGHVAVLADLPAAWLAGLVGAAPGTGAGAGAGPATPPPHRSRLAIFNIGSADDTLRGAACHPAVFHTLPSERMRTDALAQWLTVRRWSRVLLLQGPTPQDAARAAVAQASIKRFGLKLNAVRPFKLSADPRERDLANPALLTAPANAGGEYDVVWVVDSAGEFARSLVHRTVLPRPVVGDAGLTAQAWAPHFERFGAPQLSRRFAKEAGRPMTGHDWAAWIAAKAVLQAALAAVPPGATGPVRLPTAEALRQTLAREDFVLDGFKGTRIAFRPWDRQLRQPMLLGDGLGVTGSAPLDGLLHPKNVLDTLGADAPESACRPATP